MLPSFPPSALFPPTSSFKHQRKCMRCLKVKMRHLTQGIYHSPAPDVWGALFEQPLVNIRQENSAGPQERTGAALPLLCSKHRLSTSLYGHLMEDKEWGWGQSKITKHLISSGARLLAPAPRSSRIRALDLGRDHAEKPSSQDWTGMRQRPWVPKRVTRAVRVVCAHGDTRIRLQ